MPLITLTDTHTHTHTMRAHTHTFSRTSLDEGLAYYTDLYLTIHSTHTIQSFLPPVGFQPAILASEWPQTNILDLAATGIRFFINSCIKLF